MWKKKKDINKAVYGKQFSKRLLHVNKGFHPKKLAFRITGIYVIVGALWILFSDKILEMIVSDTQTLILVSLMKGWVYVLITGLALFFLLYPTLNKIKTDKERLYHMAYHDVLTDLPNRLSLNKDLSEMFNKDVDARGAVLFIDMDNFKIINDSMGHSVGDQLIIKLGERLVRLAENTGTVYRLGGDEFIIVGTNVKTSEYAEAFTADILYGFKEPIRVGESLLHINISVGVAFYPEHGSNQNELLRCADMALFKAKESGRNRYVVYSQKLDEIVAERVLIEKHLHTALENNEFELHYQPQYDLKENKVTGLEALLRWNNKELGSVPPLKFIKIAEETHLIIPLGAWVLKTACAFIKKIQPRVQGEITVAVNISMLQLLQNDFVDLVSDILEEYELNPQYLELEITESILMESYEEIEGKLKLLCSKGVKIALDDFGKGYSSLSYIGQLPITTLKIDKSFIDRISAESGHKSLTDQIVKMGGSIGLNVVAEGVETEEQLNLLIRSGCRKIQGNLFSKPLPEAEIVGVIARKL